MISALAYFLTVIAKFLISRRKTGHWAPSKFDIFIIIVNFLRSKLLSYVATREAARILSLVYTISRLLVAS